MKNIDYSQPRDYRFAQDSIALAKYASDIYSEKNRINVLDIGCGCGVVGIEFTRLHFGVEHLILVERQKVFKDHIEHNLTNLSLASESSYFIENWLDMRFDMNFDLILCNPPFYETGEGRASPNKTKQTCHFIDLIEFERILTLSMKHLSDDGAILLILPQRSNIYKKNKYRKQMRVVKKLSGDICIIQLTKNQ